MSNPEPEPMLDIARGDAALSRHLKNSLTLLRDKVADPEFGKLVDDVVSGRRSLRDTFTSPVFFRALNPLVEQGAEHYRHLSEEEREELGRTGEQQFEQLRRDEEQQAEVRARRRDEDDDEDFSDRSWLS